LRISGDSILQLRDRIWFRFKAGIGAVDRLRSWYLRGETLSPAPKSNLSAISSGKKQLYSSSCDMALFLKLGESAVSFLNCEREESSNHR